MEDGVVVVVVGDGDGGVVNYAADVAVDDAEGALLNVTDREVYLAHLGWGADTVSFTMTASATDSFLVQCSKISDTPSQL